MRFDDPKYPGAVCCCWLPLPLAGRCGQIPPVLLQGLELVLRVGIRHPLVPAHVGQRLQQRIPLETGLPGNFLEPGPTLRQQRQQQMFGRDILVLQSTCLFQGSRQDRLEFLGRIDLPATLNLRPPPQLGFEIGLVSGADDAQFLENLGHHTFLLPRQCQRQMLRIELLVGPFLSQLLCGRQRLLRLDRQLVEIHDTSFRRSNADRRFPANPAKPASAVGHAGPPRPTAGQPVRQFRHIHGIAIWRQ